MNAIELPVEVLHSSERRREADLVFATSAPIFRSQGGRGAPFELVMSHAPSAIAGTLKLAALGRIPVCDSHGFALDDPAAPSPRTRLDLVLGRTVAAWVEGHVRAVARVRFGATARAEHRWRMLVGGEVSGVSVGFSVLELFEVTARGAELRRFVARRWLVHEISLVDVPGNAEAYARGPS